IAMPAIVSIIGLMIVIGAVAYFATNSRQQPSSTNTANVNTNGAVNTNKTSSTNSPGDHMVKFTGTVLAGNSSPLLEYSKADFDAAVGSGKLVVLYFYANWCPICKAEFPKAEAAFDALTVDQVVGFRVNYNDSDTEDGETALAKEYGVAYQHTKVFLKNGSRILKSPESWETSRYTSEITKALAN
ncbi:MAG TPA: thioredoxin family protein, partial [Patescibacteria group bacterium]|nr:thioredoxin family protein [Patescibacteria group bacterium]